MASWKVNSPRIVLDPHGVCQSSRYAARYRTNHDHYVYNAQAHAYRTINAYLYSMHCYVLGTMIWSCPRRLQESDLVQILDCLIENNECEHNQFNRTVVVAICTIENMHLNRSFCFDMKRSILYYTSVSQHITTWR
jgi:hypothetical protein